MTCVSSISTATRSQASASGQVKSSSTSRFSRLAPTFVRASTATPPTPPPSPSAHEPIPKCILPEFEVFLGEVAISPYETPGTQAFADTVLPYVKDTDTVLLANHGTITYGTDLEDAYFKTEIIDAYCRILMLAKQLGTINYYSDEKAAELIKIKPGLGIRDPRLVRGLENCDLCGNSLFREGYSDFKPEPRAFFHPKMLEQGAGPSSPGLAGFGQRPRSLDE